MKSLFDKLNLRPQERRLVVIVAIVVFAVINFAFVIGHFGDLGRTQQRKRDAEKTLRKFKDELAKETQYKRDLDRLEKIGAYLPFEEQPLEFQREVYQAAQQTGVLINSGADAARGGFQQRTNTFFEEQTFVIRLTTGEKELVDFLWGLGKGQSLTRVSSMSLQRDPSQTKLAGNITLVKSFQKKPPPRAPASTVVSAAAKAKASTQSTAKTSSPPSTAKATPPATKPGATNPPAASTNLARRLGKT
jgi:hypothetical protein